MKTGKRLQTISGIVVAVGIVTTIAGSQPPPLDTVHSVIEWIGCSIMIAGILGFGIGFFLGNPTKDEG